MFFLRYYKYIANLLFWVYQLRTSKMIISTCRKFGCLSAMLEINFIIYFFLRILHFKESGNFVRRIVHFCPYLENQNFARYRVGSEISISISFIILRLFSRKTNDKIFQKIKKTLFRGHLGFFQPKFGQKLIFLEKKFVSFLIFQLSTIVQKIGKKLRTHS